MLLSSIGTESKKTHININDGNKFTITPLPYTNIVCFDNNNGITLHQDNNKVYDSDIEIVLGYCGNILSETSRSLNNQDDEYDNKSDTDYKLKYPDYYENPHVEIIDLYHCNEISTKVNLEDIYTNLSSFPSIPKSLRHDYDCYWKTYKLSLYDSKLYVISDVDTNQILNVLYAPKYDLQQGDNATYVYLLDYKHLLIYNEGDVYSAIIIQKT